MDTADSLRRFVFEKEEIRGSIVRLDKTWQQLAAADNYPPKVRPMLGEALAATALLGRNLKFDGNLTLQIQGGVHVRLLVLQCDNDLRMRGLAQFGDDLPDSFTELVDGSSLCVTVETTSHESKRYQSIVPLSEVSLAESLGHYYRQSVQLPTFFMLAADEQRAAGLMLQVMPERKGGSGRWKRLVADLEGLDVSRISQLDESVLLSAMFPEDDIRLFNSEPVCFHCDCSEERIEAMLQLLGADELDELLNSQNPVEICCEFCNAKYLFPGERIQRIRAEVMATAGKPLH
ncbi:MAG: Hsp33 family molecular chaperone HslO [Gammaproteobacteria bacterium]|jgi:molecular chaperone Hsp33|nr:Hsp33 family molecular chaperone HslO [Gammaproteobacteria bacterium]MDP6616179.1 Hsp33 family molecular chaperone HslO [Gammaproteobacteria bacterium]MDP6695613.1 Hsp33 family molecular chaperone HslO [Gammaproteobacteria bacterium]MDP7041570.1 Hsp33 family molecular chaperone HslO [Gammaproteobacteria bacterium]